VVLLVAGQTLTVFDQHNKKLWEAKLTFPMHFLGDRPPCLETKDSLYFADAGMLTRFDLATGNVQWRLNSVGISTIQADARQGLYLASTTAGPEQLTHPLQTTLGDKIHPVIMKVNSADGKVLWRLESIGANCVMSGKFLYTSRVTKVMAALRLEDGPDTHYNLRLLNPANGDEIWDYHKVNRIILKTEVQQNWILLQFDDEVRVLKFFSL
jgi:outer membrane protein assembly factor BamB